jgi:hypothetical protein
MNIDFAAKGFVQNPDGSYSKPKRDPKVIPQAAPATRPPKRIRQDTKPLMNKLELEWLDVLKESYIQRPILIQAIRLRLANGLWYKPDFIVLNGISDPVFGYGYEVKGPHAFRGGFENLKMAATKYPSIKWFLVWKEKGTWMEQEVLP